MITAKLDVTKIEKARLFKGEKGTYLDIILIETPNGQYGDYMVVQAVTKEERLANVRGPILGNAKNVGQRQAPPKPAAPRPAPAPKETEDFSEDVPF